MHDRGVDVAFVMIDEHLPADPGQDHRPAQRKLAHTHPRGRRAVALALAVPVELDADTTGAVRVDLLPGSSDDHTRLRSTRLLHHRAFRALAERGLDRDGAPRDLHSAAVGVAAVQLATGVNDGDDEVASVERRDRVAAELEHQARPEPQASGLAEGFGRGRAEAFETHLRQVIALGRHVKSSVVVVDLVRPAARAGVELELGLVEAVVAEAHGIRCDSRASGHARYRIARRIQHRVVAEGDLGAALQLGGRGRVVAEG